MNERYYPTCPRFRQSCGYMSGWTDLRAGNYSAQPGDNRSNQLCGGADSGPLFIFNRPENGNDKVISVSAFHNPMAHNFEYIVSESPHTRKQTPQLRCGLFSGVDTIPAGYKISTMISYSGMGDGQGYGKYNTSSYRNPTIKDGIEKWGNTLAAAFGKTKEDKLADPIARNLAWYTDRGAYYYYNQDPDKSYEDSIKSNIDALPEIFYSVQYDSWRYPKNDNDHHDEDDHDNDDLIDSGCISWDADEKIFPNGDLAMYNYHNYPSSAHNKHWSHINVYRDNYEFVCDETEGACVPDDPDFFNDFFRNHSAWGLKVYEQDWMNHQYDHTVQLRTDPELGSRWLDSLNAGADASDVYIQYSMARPRQVLHSVNMNRVTQIRATQDYLPRYHEMNIKNAMQWDLGFSAIYTNALHINPFKDTFWSNSANPGNGYRENAFEPSPLMEILIAVLSTGPVAPGDKVEFLDMGLISQCCKKRGEILKPDHAVSMITEDLISGVGWNDNGRGMNPYPNIETYYPEGAFWTTRSKLPIQTFENSIDHFKIVYTLAINQTRNVDLSDRFYDIGGEYDDENPSVPSRDYLEVRLRSENIKTDFGSKYKLYDGIFESPEFEQTIDTQGLYTTIEYKMLTPVFNVGKSKIAILGEMEKFVPLSSNRVLSIETLLADEVIDLVVTLTGDQNEVIDFSILDVTNGFGQGYIIEKTETVVFNHRSEQIIFSFEPNPETTTTTTTERTTKATTESTAETTTEATTQSTTESTSDFTTGLYTETTNSSFSHRRFSAYILLVFMLLLNYS